MDQPAGPAAPRRPLHALFDRMSTPATVQDVELVTPHVRRIRFAGPALRDLRWAPGQQVRVLVGEVPRLRDLVRRDMLRSYSIWDHDPRGTLDLGVLGHAGGGPGAIWAREVRPGASVSFIGPEGRFVLRPAAGHHLFVGDDTAMIAFANMLGALPSAARVGGVIQIGDPTDRLEISRGDDLTWVTRNGDGPDAAGLVDAVRALPLPGEAGAAYVAGEARSCQAVVRHLTHERGWPRRSVLVKPFWAPGKRGLD